MGNIFTVEKVRETKSWLPEPSGTIEIMGNSELRKLTSLATELISLLEEMELKWKTRKDKGKITVESLVTETGESEEGFDIKRPDYLKINSDYNKACITNENIYFATKYIKNTKNETTKAGIKLYKVNNYHSEEEESGMEKLIADYYLDKSDDIERITCDHEYIYLYFNKKITEINEKIGERKTITIFDGSDTRGIVNIVNKKILLRPHYYWLGYGLSIKDNNDSKYDYDIIESHNNEMDRKLRYVDWLGNYDDVIIYYDNEQKTYHMFIRKKNSESKHVKIKLHDNQNNRISDIKLIKITKNKILFSVKICSNEDFIIDMLYFFDRETYSIIDYKLLGYISLFGRTFCNFKKSNCILEKIHILSNKMYCEYKNGLFVNFKYD
jgi:hypothetical protein